MESFFQDFTLNEDELRIVINIFIGLAAGVLIAAGYILGNKEKKYSKNFAITVFLLPAIMAVVIPLIATDLKKALGLAGIFALVRFRSIPGDSKDILYIFLTLATGIAIGLNYYPIAFALALIISILFVITERFWKTEKNQILKITIPEDMNYMNAFDDIFNKYLVKHSVKNVKTSNMGTLFTISYNITPKSEIDVKAFIDELRTRNGNLNIIVENPDDMEAQVL